MITVIGVRFREVGKIYYFSPGEKEFKIGEHVIVDTARGLEYGTVVLSNRDVEDEEVIQPLKQVTRIATSEDDETVAQNRIKEKEALVICRKKAVKHDLEMKVIAAEYTFDNSKILFYFTAEGRIDFRELVKDLAAEFKNRIELRQVGVRDETKIVGGIGSCGRPLCCHSYLSDFVPVSIKMAKEQNLSLNPQKISGVCGRLMCCLKNEADTYAYLNSKLPKKNDIVEAPDGREGVVYNINVLRQRIKVLFRNEDEREIEEFAVEDLKFTPRKKAAQQKQKKANGSQQQALDKEKSSGKETEEIKEVKDTSGRKADNNTEKKNNKKANKNNKPNTNKLNTNKPNSNKPNKQNKNNKLNNNQGKNPNKNPNRPKKAARTDENINNNDKEIQSDNKNDNINNNTQKKRFPNRRPRRNNKPKNPAQENQNPMPGSGEMNVKKPVQNQE